MKVKQLIAKLKKMPQNLEVYASAHDNLDYEAQLVPHDVSHHIKSEFNREEVLEENLENFDSMSNEWVTING